jgi:hypothetical protein
VLRAVLLSRPKPPQAGAEGQPSQGHSSQRQLSTKVSGPPLAAVGPNRPPRRAKFTHSKFKRARLPVAGTGAQPWLGPHAAAPYCRGCRNASTGDRMTATACKRSGVRHAPFIGKRHPVDMARGTLIAKRWARRTPVDPIETLPSGRGRVAWFCSRTDEKSHASTARAREPP